MLLMWFSIVLESCGSCSCLIHVCGLFFEFKRAVCGSEKLYGCPRGWRHSRCPAFPVCITNYRKVLNPNVCIHTHFCSSAVAGLFEFFFWTLLWHDVRTVHECGLRCMFPYQQSQFQWKMFIFSKYYHTTCTESAARFPHCTSWI